MKIIHSSGEAYDLNPDTKLEFSRSNPFFSQLGEQTIPVSLPATARNLRLLQNANRTDNANKLPGRIDTVIQSGAFSVPARQAVLSAQTNGSVQTSFYINNGALYERAKNISLMDLLADQVVEFASVDAAITFVRSLYITNDDRFACFQVATENYILNKITNTSSGGFANLYNSVETTETIDGNTVKVPKGFYISPFIKVKHLLELVLAEMGYTLQPSFLDSEPFKSMVFLNDTLDAIVDGKIRYVDIVPNIMASTLFEVLRKFNIEFVPDEGNKTVSIVHFNDMYATSPSVTLSDVVDGHPIVNYHNEYKQLMLSSDTMQMPDIVKPLSYYIHQAKTTYSSVRINQVEDTFIEIVSRYPGLWVDRYSGDLLHQAFRGDWEYTHKVGSLDVAYYAGGILTAEQKKFPDTIPPMLHDTASDTVYPYAGAGRFLRSNITFSDNTTSGETSENELRPMLCFRFASAVHKCDIGTTSNYSAAGAKLWDYSLMYNGVDGIFERFWRNYDKLLRNALLEIEYNLLLSEKDKFSIGATDKVSVQSQDYFIKELKYVPEELAIQSCRFLSLNLQLPVSEARAASDYFTVSPYKWKLNTSKDFATTPQDAVVLNKSTPTTLLPAPPTQAQYLAGGQYYLQTHAVEYGHYDRDGMFVKKGDGTVTTWLTAILA